MPPLPPVTGVIKTDLQFTFGSDTNVHSHLFWHYTSAPPSTADLTTWSQAVSTSWAADMAQDHISSVVLTAVTSTDLSNPSQQPGISSASHAGSLPGGTLTAETCVLINLRIGRRYRGGHPRVYLPLGSASQLSTPQLWLSTYVSQVQGNWNTFVASLLGVGPPGPTCDHLANVSYHSNKTLRPTPLVDPVLASVVNPIPASQRRRMGR